MNQFAKYLENESTVTTTENGDRTYSTSTDSVVDLFFRAGAVRHDPKSILKDFRAAYKDNPYLATKVALWARDIRGGAGERQVFREILTELCRSNEGTDRVIQFMHLIPVVGRWDDLFVLTGKARKIAFGFFAEALVAGDGLACKWAPREKSAQKDLAKELREFMGLTQKAYRQLIVAGSNTVEQQMCGQDWNDINFSHVPSVASARYSKAFRKHQPERYQAYLEAVMDKNKPDVKINTSAVFPYDVVKSNVDDQTANAMWENLPDYVPEGLSFMPVVDTSGSMWGQPIEIAISLGIYLSERNKSDFKDLFITFSQSPALQKVRGANIRDKYANLKTADWDMNTNLDKAMKLILDLAVKSGASQEDMPDFLLVMSDMEFDGGSWSGNRNTSVTERTKNMFADAGYEMPNIVWWNIQSRNSSTPVRANDKGMALVSGASPSVVKGLLAGNITPVNIMLEAVDISRYDY